MASNRATFPALLLPLGQPLTSCASKCCLNSGSRFLYQKNLVYLSLEVVRGAFRVQCLSNEGDSYPEVQEVAVLV